jgi:gliding-associated putative ABC transporter substrate-binding component GldG
VYPYARISAAGKEENFCLQQQRTIANNESAVDDLLNYSESMMEYNIINAIRTIQQPSKKSIAYIVGHGEPTDYKILHLLFSMSQYYKVDTVKLSEQVAIPSNYAVTIINNPRYAFTDKDKLILDQYIMNGGHTLWLLDGVQVNNDSLIKYPSYTALPLELNLSDLLYKYGVRINSNLVQDRQCGSLVVQVGLIDGKADYRPLDWDLYPVVTPIAKHPVVHNMDPLWMRYASSLDTINNNLSKKTILLESSNLSKTIASPALISLNSLKLKPKMSSYTKKFVPMAIALEGGFKSAFANRLSPEQLALYTGELKLTFKDEVSNSKMIVISDGDFFLNDRLRGDVPSEMAFDKFTDKSYANSTFMLNALEWLSDETGLLEARNKDVQLRRMDPKKIKASRTQYQLLNILLPIALTIFIGSLWHFMRKKKYTVSLKK